MNPVFRSITLPALHANTGLKTMTIDGTVHRTAFLLFCVITGAVFGWVKDAHFTTPMFITCTLIAMGLIWVTIYKKGWSAVTAPAYALLEGVVLGTLSAGMEAHYHGIAVQAVALTFGICVCLLILYRTGLVRVTARFNKALVAATGGVALFYLATLVLSFLGFRPLSVFAGGIPGILVSLAIIAVAALNLAADFDFVERCVKGSSPKYMEWYAALGLIVTLVWLYVEILRLLTKARKAGTNP